MKLAADLEHEQRKVGFAWSRHFEVPILKNLRCNDNDHDQAKKKQHLHYGGEEVLASFMYWEPSMVAPHSIVYCSTGTEGHS